MSEQLHFPCQSCGANLVYAPSTNYMLCSHCDHKHEIDISVRNHVHELDYYSELNEINQKKRDNKVIQESMITQCNNCAAQFPMEESLHADDCPYCGSAIVNETHSHKYIKPWGMLPFSIKADDAWQYYKRWLKSLWFAPSKLKKYAKTHQKLNGMYVPYWTFDTSTYTQYQGQRGTYYQIPTTVRVQVNGRWQTRTKMITKVRWSYASGSVNNVFDDVLIYASKTLPRSIARELEPWDLSKLTDYKKEYISGFQSEVYQTGLEEAFEKTRERISPHIHSAIKRDIGGDLQRINQVNTQHSNIKFRHILLPFWVAGFQFNKKTYQFVVNGRTGEVQGERPYSTVKIFFFSLFVLFILFIAGLIIFDNKELLHQLYLMYA